MAVGVACAKCLVDDGMMEEDPSGLYDAAGIDTMVWLKCNDDV